MKGKNINQALRALQARVEHIEGAADQRGSAIRQVSNAVAMGRDAAAVDQLIRSTGNAAAIKEQSKSRINDGAGL